MPLDGVGRNIGAGSFTNISLSGQEALRPAAPVPPENCHISCGPKNFHELCVIHIRIFRMTQQVIEIEPRKRIALVGMTMRNRTVWSGRALNAGCLPVMSYLPPARMEHSSHKDKIV